MPRTGRHPMHAHYTVYKTKIQVLEKTSATADVFTNHLHQ